MTWAAPHDIIFLQTTEGDNDVIKLLYISVVALLVLMVVAGCGRRSCDEPEVTEVLIS